MEYLAIYILAWMFLFGVPVFWVALQKNRNPWTWLLAAFFFGFGSWFMIACVPTLPKAKPRKSEMPHGTAVWE